MADQRLTDKTSMVTIADDDLFHSVDVSDTTANPNGTSKKTLFSLIKSTLKTYFDTLYAKITQTTAENLTLTGTVNLDLATFDSFEGLLTGNTTITVTNTPAVGETFVRNLRISGSLGTETLTLPVGWTIYGEYVVDAVNKLTVEFANFTTGGLKVDCFINQPT